MSVKQRLDNQSKLIALNVLKVCREEKQNGELFLPLASHLARASACMLTGVPERSLVRFRTGNLHENSTRKVRSDKLEVDDFDRCVIRRTINDMLVSRKVLPTVETFDTLTADTEDSCSHDATSTGDSFC